MIERYEIKKENNSNTLYLYLSYDYEFSSLNINNIKKDIHKVINNINKIYKTNKIKIIIGGIVILTIPMGIYYSKINSNTNSTYNDNIAITEIIKEENIINDESTTIENIKEENIKIDNTVDKNSSIYSITSNIETNTNSNTNNDATNTNTNTNINTNNETNTINEVSTTNENLEQTYTINEEKIDNNTYVTINRTNGEIITIELEEYIIGVVSAEMPASFNTEALKAQAVIARTYALKRLNEGKILTDNSSTQNYKDNNQLQAYWQDNYNKYYNKVKDAVLSTKGEYITYNNYYIDAVYHASNNGYTIDASNLWNYDIPYLKSVDSNWDKSTTSYKREIILDINLVNNILGININNDSIIETIRDNTNHISTITIDNNTYTGKVFREKLSLRSTDFEIEIQDNNLVITTYGYGHAVGLSQYGANEMAKLGYNYQDIIHYYYNSVNIIK